MPEKAVDETLSLGGMNVFNAVTSKIHPSLRPKSPDGGSVNGKRNKAGSGEQGAGSQPDSRVPGFAPGFFKP